MLIVNRNTERKGKTMKQYDIYVGTNGEEATSHGAEFVFSGYNPADALTRFVSDAQAMGELRHDRPDYEQLAAFDDEMSARLYPLEDGSWELHILTDEADTVVTIPPTEYVSASDAAEMLGVTRQRVNVLAAKGKLNGEIVGNTWMIARASVETRMLAVES